MGPDHENDDFDMAFLNDRIFEYLQDVVPLLRESDIPGASLNGKQPVELNIQQLKRWLACRGAPTTGNEPEFIER